MRPVRAQPTDVSAVAGRAPTVHVLQLASAKRAYQVLERNRHQWIEGRRLAAWSDFSMLLQAVAGREVDGFTLDDLVALSPDGGPRVPVSAGLVGRDRTAYRMLALGYSARETADVVSGRITRQELDTAWAMIAAGRGRAAAADYLDAGYARGDARLRRARARAATQPGSGSDPGARPSGFDAAIDRHARAHGVDARLVRAVMAAESAFDPSARSPVGAVGLMQLMPMTARELGVNPFDPDQNIEGGVRYLRQMLQTFGNLELALIAYNAGPGFAQRYARGQTALYGETRAYVRSVLSRMAGDSSYQTQTNAD